MSGANLEGVKSGSVSPQDTSISLPPAVSIERLPPGFSIRNGYIIGPGVNLTGADLTRATFAHCILTYANLTDAVFFANKMDNADLTGAILTGVKSGNITGNPILDSNYSTFIKDGYIIGPGVNLTDVNLDDVDLTGADLKEINLTNANLSNATLTDADLRLANLSGVDMSTVTIGESTTPLLPLQFIKKDLRNRSIQNVKISSLENSIIDSTINFAGADLTSVDFSKAIFKGTPGDRQKALGAGWSEWELRAIDWTA